MPLLPLTKVCNRLIDTTSMLYWMLLSFVRRSSPQLTQLNPEIIPYQFSLSPLRHFNTVRISSPPACYRTIWIPYSLVRFTKASICFPAFVVSCMVENIFISFASLCFHCAFTIPVFLCSFFWSEARYAVGLCRVFFTTHESVLFVCFLKCYLLC